MYESTVKLSIDGNQVCALIGNDLEDGYAGFGDTVQYALRDLANVLDIMRPSILRAKGVPYVR